MIRVKVPATTANMGPGFDSIGMALSLYNHTEVREGADNGTRLDIRLKNASASRAGVPLNEDNLIYKSLRYFCESVGRSEIPSLTIIQEDYIPMTGGLGSSAACIVAGLLAGNALTGFPLPREEIINMAAALDGHPDNTTPALTGGLTAGVMADGRLIYSKIRGAWEERLKFALFLPGFTLPTEKARAVLPSEYTRSDVVFNASRSALLIAALTSGEFDKLSAAMDDRVHQPYRRALVPGMAEIQKAAAGCGAYNVFLSGAGSALIAVTESPGFIDKVNPCLKSLEGGWSVGWVQPDHTGAVVEIC